MLLYYFSEKMQIIATKTEQLVMKLLTRFHQLCVSRNTRDIASFCLAIIFLADLLFADAPLVRLAKAKNYRMIGIVLPMCAQGNRYREIARSIGRPARHVSNHGRLSNKENIKQVFKMECLITDLSINSYRKEITPQSTLYKSS